MDFNGDKVMNVNIAYIGGGSRGWAWKLMADLALEDSMSGRVKLYDIDFDSACRNEIIGNRLTSRGDSRGKWNYSAVKSLDDALEGANFVIISILPGTFKEMQSDVHLPEEYGIYQSVGDTVGPGGLMRALRTIPAYIGIADAIRKYCPLAWVINYTNPMAVCTRTLYKVFPGIKAFGCCHEVFGTQRILAEVLRVKTGISASRDDIRINVLGINHFTWIDRAYYRNIDLIPLYREYVEENYESGVEGIEKEGILADYFKSKQRVKFDLFRRYGVVAAAGDRHLAEFVPSSYLMDPQTVEDWKFKLTPVWWRIENLKEKKLRSERLAAGKEEIDVKPSGEEGVRQMKALTGLEVLVTNINMPNKGQLGDLPEDAVVETNAVFSGDSVRPVMAGKLPEPVNAMVKLQSFNQEKIVCGFMEKRKDVIFKAFTDDPAIVRANLSISEAKALFEQMLKNTAGFLPDWLKK